MVPVDLNIDAPRCGAPATPDVGQALACTVLAAAEELALVAVVRWGRVLADLVSRKLVPGLGRVEASGVQLPRVIAASLRPVAWERAGAGVVGRWRRPRRHRPAREPGRSRSALILAVCCFRGRWQGAGSAREPVPAAATYGLVRCCRRAAGARQSVAPPVNAAPRRLPAARVAEGWRKSP